MTDQSDTSGSTYQVEAMSSVMVDVIDHHENAIKEHDGPFMPDEKRYERVEILESGWVRCVGPEEDRGGSDDEVAVDYYPPECIAGMYSVEEA